MTMPLTVFQDLLDSLGPDMPRWPADRRAEAEMLLASSDQARAALDAARKIDAALRTLSATPVKAPDGLLDRITAAVRDEQSGKKSD